VEISILAITKKCLRIMSRHAKLITLDTFKDLCEKKLGIGTDEFDLYDIMDSHPIIEKDLAKLDFDMENWAIGNAHPDYTKYPSDYGGFNGYPCGYEVLPSGLPVLFVNAGGDWEFPICFCIYWDGSRMRAYIPKEGNVYNRKSKAAYGNEDDDEIMDLVDEAMCGVTKDPRFIPDPSKIREDVMKRIVLI
jgi:hypothetical protein